MTETNFPLAPTFADSMLAPPPVLEEGLSTEEHLQTLKKYLDGQYVSLNKMQNSIASGWLVSTLRVLNLTADTIVADSVFTQDLWIGKDDSTNGYIGLLGTATQIKIVDENGTTRFLAGDLGAGVTNWGVQMMDTAGVVIFEAGDQVFIDGAVITDATIVNAKIVNSTIDGATKLANSSVPNSKISDLSASKINAGTLTVNGSPGLTVTGTANALFSNGADLQFNAASSGGTSYMKFRNNAGTNQGLLSWDVTTDTFTIESVSGDFEVISNAGDLLLVASGGDISMLALSGGGGVGRIDLESSGFAALRLDENGNVSINGGVIEVDGIIRPNAHKTIDLGQLGLAFDTVYADDFNNVADIAFQNGMVILEADKVYQGAPGELGEFILLPNKQPGFWFDGEGNLHIKGKVFMDVDFDQAFSQYQHIDYWERQAQKAIDKEQRIAEAQAKKAQEKQARDDKRAQMYNRITPRLEKAAYESIKKTEETVTVH